MVNKHFLRLNFESNYLKQLKFSLLCQIFANLHIVLKNGVIIIIFL